MIILDLLCRGEIQNPGRNLWATVTSSDIHDLWSYVAVYRGPLYGPTNVPAHPSLWILIQWTVTTHTHTHRLTYASSHIIDLARMNLFEVLGPAGVFWRNELQMCVCTLNTNFKCLTVSQSFQAHTGTYFFLVLKPLHNSSHSFWCNRPSIDMTQHCWGNVKTVWAVPSVSV